MHFAGHATKDALILAREDQLNNIHEIPWEFFTPTFNLVADTIQCAFFNAADTIHVAQELSKIIPYTIGISGMIPQ